MESWMSSIMNHKKEGRPPVYIDHSVYSDHSCHRFLTHEDLRPQMVTNTDDEREISTPPKPTNYLWQIQFSTPNQIYSHFMSSETPSPTTSSTSDSSEASPAGFYRQNVSPLIKQEPVSTVHNGTTLHPYSIEALVGDVLDLKGEPSRPADVFSSTYLNEEINKYIMYQSLFTAMYSTPGYSPTQRLPESKLNAFYWCHVCNAMCVNKEDAQRHKTAHFTNGEKSRLRSTIYKEHGCVTVHERLDEDRIQCGLCDKVVSHCFFSKHQRLHEGHFCDECGKEFSTNSRLQDHKNTHTGITPFTCTICNRQFAKRSSWTQHQRYHRDHQSFKCQYCKKRFNSKYACAVHERLHTGENPYKCDFPGCNRSYPQKIQLKLHMNSHR